MGCVPSKSAADRKVVPTAGEIPMAGKPDNSNTITAAPAPILNPSTTAAGPTERPPTPKQGWSERSAPESNVISDATQKDGNVSDIPPPPIQQRGDSAIGRGIDRDIKPLDKPLMPPIQHTDNLNADAPMFPQAAEGPTKPVAFEIPLGENLFGSLTKENSSSLGSMNRSPATVGRLPSLGLTNDDIKAKLANADARWKDLENEELVRKDTSRRRRAKPKLSSNARPKTRQGREEDPEVLKQRLLEKETQAEKNRQRELQKLQAKLARMDQHVRRVQERKRFLEMGSSTDDMSLSVSTSSVSLAV